QTCALPIGTSSTWASRTSPSAPTSLSCTSGGRPRVRTCARRSAPKERKTMAMLHPLDPLTTNEIRAAVSVVRASGRLGDDVLFVRVFLEEPPKSAVLAFRRGDPLERQALVLLGDRRARTTCEVIVSITARTLVS